MRFNISFENAELDAVLPANVDATPGVKGDKLSTDENDSGIVPAVDTLLEIEKDMLADGPDEGVVDGHSAEEAAVENAVAIENALNEIASELDENHRVIEVAEGLEDIRTIVQATPEGETVDIPMMQTAANMAVAGTTAEASSILPAMEAFKDKEVALEALGEKIAAATASVIESIKNMGSKLTTLLKNIFDSIARLEEGLKQREVAVRAIKGNVQFSVKGSRFLQKDQQNYVTDGPDYVKELTRTVQFFGAWTPVAVKSVASFDGSIGAWYSSLGNLEKSRAATKRIYDSYVKEFGQGVKSLPGVETVKGSKEVETFRTPVMLGGAVLEATLPRNIVEFDTGSSSDVRACIQQTTVRFAKDYMMHDKATPTINFTLAPKDLKTIIDMDKELLASVKQYLNESYKRFKRWSDFNMGASEKFIVPNSTLLVNKGMNHAAFYVGWSRAYGEGVMRSSFIVLDKAIAASGKTAPAASATPAAA